MTEEERKELERQKDWVKHRINCTMRAVFDRLVDTIRHDVYLYNESTNGTGFEVREDAQVVVETVNEYGDKDYVALKLQDQDKCIEIKRRSKVMFTVKPQWDEGNLECKLFVDDEPYTYPQISQKAIGSLLFNGAVFPSTMGGG